MLNSYAISMDWLIPAIIYNRRKVERKKPEDGGSSYALALCPCKKLLPRSQYLHIGSGDRRPESDLWYLW